MKTINNVVEEALRKLRTDMHDNINYYYEVYDYKHSKFFIVLVPVNNGNSHNDESLNINTKYNSLMQMIEATNSNTSVKEILDVINYYSNKSDHYIIKNNLKEI